MVTRVPMTVGGAEKLRAELEHLKRVERPRISKAIAEAAGAMADEGHIVCGAVHGFRDFSFMYFASFPMRTVAFMSTPGGGPPGDLRGPPGNSPPRDGVALTGFDFPRSANHER